MMFQLYCTALEKNLVEHEKSHLIVIALITSLILLEIVATAISTTAATTLIKL